MRKLIVLLVFGLIAAACGGSDTTSNPSEATQAPANTAVDSTAPETNEGSAAEEPPASEAPPSAETQPDAADQPAAPSFDGPPAPAFDLALADGGTFSLADEQKPTYMVFWAEW